MSQSTLDKILDAATSVFAEYGFAGATVEEIARTAGVNKAALYYHVGNKEALYERVISHKLSSAADRLEESLDSARGGRDGLERLVNGLAEHFTLRPRMPRIMVQELARGGANLSPAVVAQMARLIGCTRRVAAMAAQEGGARVNPLALHITLVATLAFHSLSSPLRERAAAMPLATGMDLDLDIDTLASMLKTSLSAMLFPGSAAPESGEKGEPHV